MGRNRVQPRRRIARPPVRRSSVSPRRPTCSARALPATSLRDAFRLEDQANVSVKATGRSRLEGVRFEIPARYRHFRDVSGALRPLGPEPGRSGRPAQRNHPGAPVSSGPQGQRRRPTCSSSPTDGSRCRPTRDRVPTKQSPTRQLPPLLKRILDEYSATGMPPAYLPKNPAFPTHGETP